MATTYPLTLPTGYLRSLTMRRSVVVGVNESPFTKARQVFLWPGERWEAELTFVPTRGVDARKLVAFFNSLDGPVGTFLANDPSGYYPLGVARYNPGTPLVDGASQTGESLNIKGLPTSRAGWLLAGSFVQLGSGSTTRLHQAVADAATDSSGKTTLTLRPRIKTAPAADAAVVLTGALGIWSLASNKHEWHVDESGLHTMTAAIVEPR